jgi:hypothetical protein
VFPIAPCLRAYAGTGSTTRSPSVSNMPSTCCRDQQSDGNGNVYADWPVTSCLRTSLELMLRGRSPSIWDALVRILRRSACVGDFFGFFFSEICSCSSRGSGEYSSTLKISRTSLARTPLPTTGPNQASSLASSRSITSLPPDICDSSPFPGSPIDPTGTRSLVSGA